MSELSDKTDRSYDLLLLRLERWLDELATFGPSHVSVVYRQMAKVMENEIPSSYAEPHIDFNHQKGYN